MRYYQLSFFSLLIMLLYYGQEIQGQGLLDDIDFFESQELVYQQWLEDSGIGSILKVHTLEVEEESISLYLAFQTDDPDLCWSQWEQLKEDFAKLKPIRLEQQLFYKMITILDVQQTAATIQIYDTYDLDKVPCFFQGIYFDQDQKKVLVEQNKCKSAIVNLKVKPTTLNELVPDSITSLPIVLSKQEVYRRTLDWAKQKYTLSTCEDRYPDIVLLENDEVLRFRAEDICLHVLQDQKNPFLCYMINLVCYKRERLTYTISYRQVETHINIEIEIDGRYGSGFFDKVGRKGYHLMDNDYKEELIDYTERIREELREVLK